MAEQGAPAEVLVTRDQATALVGRHLLVTLEDILHAHEGVVDDATKTETQKANARLIISTAQGFGRPLWHVVKAAERPRILRPERSIRIVR